MIPNGLPGVFVAFEGMDGCGKSLITEMLIEVFERDLRYWTLTKEPGGLSENLLVVGNKRLRPIQVVKTKEPGKDRLWGKRIYEELPKPVGVHTLDPFGFQKWYALDSAENLETIIVPSLRLGKLVVSDRFRPSMVYGAEDSDDIGELMRINEVIIGRHFIWPDLILIFDVPVDVAAERLAKKGRPIDQYERGPVLERVRSNYKLFAENYPNCYVIDATKSPEEILEEVMSLLIPILKAKGTLVL